MPIYNVNKKHFLSTRTPPTPSFPLVTQQKYVQTPLSLLVTKQKYVATKPVPVSSISTLGDTGATNIIVRKSDATCLGPIADADSSKLTMQVANGSSISSSTSATFGITPDPCGPQVTAHIFDDSQLATSLTGIAPLCNQGCEALFTATDVTIRLGDKIIMRGTKGPSDTVWPLSLPVFLPSAPLAVAMSSQSKSYFDSANDGNRSLTLRKSLLNQIAEPSGYRDMGRGVEYCALDGPGSLTPWGIQGSRPHSNLLYKNICSNLPSTTQSADQSYSHSSPQDITGAASLVIRHELVAEKVLFAHQTFGSPATSGFIKAAKAGYLNDFLSSIHVSVDNIVKNAPNTVETARGHLDLTRQGQRSTKAPNDVGPAVPIADEDSVSDDDYNNVYIHLMPVSEVHSSDLTGRFPVKSRTGCEYLLVSVNNGYVHVEPVASRVHKTSIVPAFKDSLTFFSKNPNRNMKVQVMDNETSKDLRNFLSGVVEETAFAPPKNHRYNKAERAIQDWKKHFIATLCTCHYSFPVDIFDALIFQAELTLNHLRAFPPNRAISAWEGLYQRKYDFHAHPIAPLGMRVLVHENAADRATWAVHGVDGFYVGPAPETYRSFICYVPSTQAFRTSDTLAWFPVAYKMPGSSAGEHLIAAINDLTGALSTIADSGAVLGYNRQPFETSSGAAIASLREVAALFAPPPHNSIDVAEQRVPSSPRMRVSPPTDADTVVVAPGFLPLQPPMHVVMAPISVAPAPPAPAQRQKSRKQSKPGSVKDNPEAPTVAAPAGSIAAPNARIPPPGATAQPSAPVPVSGAVTRRMTAAMLAQQDRGDVIFETDPNAVHPSQALNLDANGNPLTMASALKGPDAPLWVQERYNELVRLLDSGTLHGTLMTDIPVERRRDITYYNEQVKEKMKNGAIARRVRGTAGGDKTHFTGDVSAQTADMDVVKILIHSVSSDGADFIAVDIKDYYLGTTLERPEFLRILSRNIPVEIMTQYNLYPFVHGDFVLFRIDKGMYGLPQAGLLAQNRLVDHLATGGYTQSPTVPCLFRHATRNITFTLVVDDFGIKCHGKDDAEHLIATLKQLYEITVDWEGKQYLGYTIQFDKRNRHVDLSMPAYIPKVLQRFAPSLTKGAASPSVYTPPSYGARTQFTDVDDSAAATPSQIKRLQEIVGSFLYYARAVDTTMLEAVNHLASMQANPTQRVMEAADRLLAYAAAYPCNKLRLTACGMILHIQSDASYLSRDGSRSVAGGIFYLGNRDSPTHINGAIHAISSIIGVIVSSAAEAEYAALFINAQHGAWLRTVLEAFGYPQPPTLIMCDNACAVGIANNTVKIKRSKCIDMRFHWIRDRITQGQFVVQWREGANNLADFFTKAQPVHIHQELMPYLVYSNHVKASSLKRIAAWKEQQQQQRIRMSAAR